VNEYVKRPQHEKHQHKTIENKVCSALFGRGKLPGPPEDKGHGIAIDSYSLAPGTPPDFFAEFWQDRSVAFASCCDAFFWYCALKGVSNVELAASFVAQN